MIHEDESFPYKKKSVKIEIEDEERIPFQLIMILSFTKGCDFNSLFTGGEEKRHFSQETSLKNIRSQLLDYWWKNEKNKVTGPICDNLNKSGWG